MKSYQYQNFGSLENIRYTSTATFAFIFLVNGRLVWGENTSSTSPGTMIHVMHVLFVIFAVFENLKASFSSDNMSVHALDVLFKTPPKWFELSHLTEKMRINL